MANMRALEENSEIHASAGSMSSALFYLATGGALREHLLADQSAQLKHYLAGHSKRHELAIAPAVHSLRFATVERI